MKSKKFVTIWLGNIKYQTARQFIRESLHPLCRKGQNFLVFCNHPPIVTLGKNMSDPEKALVRAGFDGQNIKPEFLDVDRGGKATFHDNEQLMIYPISYLPNLKRGVKSFIMDSLKAVTMALGDIGIVCLADDNLLGLWCNEKKIASVGFRILDRLSDHGIALCLDEIPVEFSCFSPCGVSGIEYTSVSEVLGGKVDNGKLRSLISMGFEKQFDLEKSFI